MLPPVSRHCGTCVMMSFDASKMMQAVTAGVGVTHLRYPVRKAGV